MIFLLKEPHRAELLFAGWEETMLYSCLQGVMGNIYVTDPEHPRAACAVLGDFAFLTGEPERELLRCPLPPFVIAVPRDPAWQALVVSVYPQAHRVTRYATHKNTVFDPDRLRGLASALPLGYTLRRIDALLYGRCLASPVLADLVSVFGSRNRFLRDGIGFVVCHEGEVVAGASSYSRYRSGIEVEVDTLPGERRRGLATAAAARLILSCTEAGWYPSWDAQNPVSLHLAQKLGYVFSHAYTAFEIRTK